MSLYCVYMCMLGGGEGGRGEGGRGGGERGGGERGFNVRLVGGVSGSHIERSC